MSQQTYPASRKISALRVSLFSINPNNTFSDRLKALLAEFPRVDVHAMGFPTEWDKESLWN